MRVCQHPQASEGICDRVIDAHTVPRAALSRFAVDGHVVQLNLTDPTAVFRGHEPRIEAHPCGINEASTMPIFYGRHDSAVFAPIEVGAVSASAESALLFHYRAAVRQRVNSEYRRRGYDRVWQKTEAVPESARGALREEIIFEMHDSIRNGARDTSYKRLCDHLLETKSTREVRAVFVEFGQVPHFMCCGMFDPAFDFTGRSLQQLAHPLARIAGMVDPVALTVIGTERGGLAVLSSVGFGLAAEHFLASVMALPDSDKSDAITRLAYGVVENAYFAPSWWNAMDDAEQREFVRAANARYGARLADDVLAPRVPHLSDWEVSSVRSIGVEGVADY